MRSRLYIAALSFAMLGLNACIPTRNLGENEKLLVSMEPKGLESVDPTAIQNLYQQEPNRMVLGSTPYLALYNFGKKFYDPQKIQQRIEKQENRMAQKITQAGTDSVKINKLREKYNDRIDRLEAKLQDGNFVMQLGEPPAIYDSLRMQETMDQIDIYLNSKGYFNHRAAYTKEVKKDKLLYIDVNIEENQPYLYSELSYGIADPSVLQIVKSTEARSLLKLQERYDEEQLTQERDRLYELLKNRGYYDFARAYIEFEVDTSYARNTVRVKTIIDSPEQDSTHKVYTLKDVYFKTDADRFGIPRDTITYNGIKYVAYDHKYSPLILDKKVDIYPGQRYSQFRTLTTQRKLADLDVFQFNNVFYNKVQSPTDSTYELIALVNALPAKKFQETAELGMNFTEKRPGPFSSLTLRVRNVFGGTENLDFGIRGGIEYQASLSDPDEAVMIREFGLNTSLSFPVILLPFTNKNLLSEFTPRTRFTTGYNSENRQEYIRSTYELGLDYIWQRSRNPLQPPVMQFILSPVNFNIVQGEIKDVGFRSRLESNSTDSRSLLGSFDDGIISFVGFNFIYNTNDFTQTRNARFFRTLVEVGGLSKELGLNININNLRTYQYARVNPDYRRYIPLGGQRFFVYRFNTGVASPILSGNTLPYDKFFFGGGASSVRAWQSRRLGLGSYASLTVQEDAEGNKIIVRDYNIEQPGEVLIEANVEYRFNMFSFINGAFFVDAGNVWLLEADVNRPGADFRFNRFYKELAVGTGFGLRFDLSVLILRFDFATKVYDPAVWKEDRFVLPNFNVTDFFTRNNQSTLQIGIGYPF
ncbi:translocation and assembly module lipoprotein TamL [Pontibacter anaerobius]|uniref:BamA/TamA family outer membrane protein n=1 Tax=Pontibacter anaerobius TaxID=2993940 RepID=A0ABT3RCK8_9BACT|nr:BamA/TamA family outer membrane protein [Pontibacter anaerobius]MCX2739354.1 BamA/TamA family outer membrane protein [Pontibacter anaerobius]